MSSVRSNTGLRADEFALVSESVGYTRALTHFALQIFNHLSAKQILEIATVLEQKAKESSSIEGEEGTVKDQLCPRFSDAKDAITGIAGGEQEKIFSSPLFQKIVPNQLSQLVISNDQENEKVVAAYSFITQNNLHYLAETKGQNTTGNPTEKRNPIQYITGSPQSTLRIYAKISTGQTTIANASLPDFHTLDFRYLYGQVLSSIWPIAKVDSITCDFGGVFSETFHNPKKGKRNKKRRR